MKEYQRLLTIAALFAGTEAMNHGKPSRNTYKSEQQAFSKPAPIPKGCKEFNINGHKIVASNYKNACRKAANLK
ncbi:hypothetical protein LCGC14_0337540 [marine sediment metagenome]|uniref:Uncharacterized protein n=1 Tax=marine sediment metagenome TaxID=412755 RepID=A0A0F9TXP8_9ZZZZ